MHECVVVIAQAVRILSPAMQTGVPIKTLAANYLCTYTHNLLFHRRRGGTTNGWDRYIAISWLNLVIEIYQLFNLSTISSSPLVSERRLHTELQLQDGPARSDGAAVLTEHLDIFPRAHPVQDSTERLILGCVNRFMQPDTSLFLRPCYTQRRDENADWRAGAT